MFKKVISILVSGLMLGLMSGLVTGLMSGILLPVSLVSTASLVSPVTVYASQSGDPERIPYIVALRGATRNLPGIRAIEDMIDDIEDMRNSLRSLLQLRQDTGTITREEQSQLQRQIADLGAQINSMRADRDRIRIGTEAAMQASIASIANTELDIKLLEATLEYERVNLNNLRLRFEAGLVSESDLRAAELQMQQHETNLATMLVSLETERQNLNRILQRPVTGNFYVYFERELMELPANLDAHVRRYAPRQPNVRQADITLNRAQAAFSDVHLDILSPEFGERQRARNQAERVRNDMLRQVETAMRNHYNTLTTLLHRNNALEIDLQRARERHEAALLNHQAGLATIFDIESAELAIFRIEIEIEKNLNTFWQLQFMFEHPFLLTM